MRNWDNHNSYVDNDGHLLHGKIRFCQRGTTTDIAIYNSDNDPLTNPIMTDSIGRTLYQVYYPNKTDVTAYFYKYVGDGTWESEDPYDPTLWSLQYTSDEVYPVDTLDIDFNSASGCGDMSDLRSLDVTSVPLFGGYRLAWLYGYYESGDTSPVLYIWDESCTIDDDGGSVIQSDDIPGAGRWRLVPTGELHFDVRHFGIFPTDSIYEANYNYTSQLAHCASYCNACGIDAWFPSLNDELSYYSFDGSNSFAINGDLYISDKVRWQFKTGTNTTVISCNKIHKNTPYLCVSTQQTGLATLNCYNVNMSWLGGQVTCNAHEWTIDTDDYTRIITDANVIFEVNGNYALQLDNCTVESHKAISGPIVMQHMAVKTEWFADSYNWGNLSLYNCTVTLRDCKDADTYITLKNKLLQYDYGDLGEQIVHNASFGANCVVENCGGTATFAGAAELHNVTLTASFTASTTDLNCLDTWLTINGTPTFSMIQLNRGSIGGSAGINILNTLKCTDVTIDNSVNLSGATLLLDHCVINGAISHIGDPIQENVRGCIFNNSISIRGGGSDVVIQAVWQDNVGFVADPLIIDKTNLAMLDSAHTYTYSGNSGTFLPSDKVKFTRYLAVTDSFATATQTDNYIQITKDAPDAPSTAHFREDAYYDQQNPTFDHGFSGTLKMFRIGRDEFPVLVNWRISATTGPQSFTFQIAPIPFRMRMVNSDGMDWKCVVYKGTYDIGGANTYDTHIGLYLNSFASAPSGFNITGNFEAVR